MNIFFLYYFLHFIFQEHNYKRTSMAVSGSTMISTDLLESAAKLVVTLPVVVEAAALASRSSSSSEQARGGACSSCGSVMVTRFPSSHDVEEFPTSFDNRQKISDRISRYGSVPPTISSSEVMRRDGGESKVQEMSSCQWAIKVHDEEYAYATYHRRPFVGQLQQSSISTSSSGLSLYRHHLQKRYLECSAFHRFHHTEPVTLPSSHL